MAFRIVVGFGMGGEWGAGAALVSETWPSEHRGKALAIMQSAWAVGGLLAAAVAGPIVEAFGWRWVFFLGITPAIVTYFVRRHIDESAIWTQKNQLAESSTVKNSVPIIEIFKGSLLKTTLLASLFMIVVMIGNYSFNTWLPTYLATPVAKGGAGLSITKSSLYVIPYWIGCFLGYLSFGFISDKIGRRKTFSGFFIMAAALIPVYIKAALYPAIFLIIAPLVGFFVMGFFGGFGAILSELYPTRVRVTGQGFCYNVGRGAGAVSITFVGALAVTAGIGTAMMIASGLFFVAAILIWTLPETVGKELE
jgi:MFS family permease